MASRTGWKELIHIIKNANIREDVSIEGLIEEEFEELEENDDFSEASLEMMTQEYLAAGPCQSEPTTNYDYEGLVEESEEHAFLYDWEMLMDSTLILDNGQKTNVLFSRVYIDDSDLMKLGAEDEDSLNKLLDKLKIIECSKRKKFLNKLSRLGYMPGFGTDIQSFTSASTPKNFVDVVFKEYRSEFGQSPLHYKSQRDFNFSPTHSPFAKSPSPPSSSFREGNSPSSSSSPLGAEKQSSGKAIQQQDRQDDDKSGANNFDFEFDAERDAKLVAMDANKYFDKEVMKYWFQRYRLFSKLNEGILMDRECWFSVTPEKLAEHIADRMVTRKDYVILDAFAGAGGNAIQFAKRGAFVYAVDLDPIKVRCAMRNAKIYGVEKRISFICGDFFDVAAILLGEHDPAASQNSLIIFPANFSADDYDGDNVGISLTNYTFAHIHAVFLSPPWGGPAYLNSRHFDLDEHMEPRSGSEIYRIAKQISPNICYFLPRNTTLLKMFMLDEKIELEQAVLNGKVKTLSAYFGNLIAES